MKEERMTILRMVAEGKITAEEAETLLRALGSNNRENQRQSRRRVRARRSWPIDVENIVEDTVGFVDDVVGSFEQEFSHFTQNFDSSSQTIPAPEGTTLVLESHTGHLTLFGTDEADVKISGALRRHYKVKEHNNVIRIKANRHGAALTVHIPATVTQLIVKSHTSEIITRNLTNALKSVQIGTHTGKIALDMGPISVGQIMLKSHVGEIHLVLPESSQAEVHAATDRMGEITTELPFENMERGLGYLKGTLNGGGADIRISTHVGGIVIEPH